MNDEIKNSNWNLWSKHVIEELKRFSSETTSIKSNCVNTGNTITTLKTQVESLNNNVTKLDERLDKSITQVHERLDNIIPKVEKALSDQKNLLEEINENKSSIRNINNIILGDAYKDGHVSKIKLNEEKINRLNKMIAGLIGTVMTILTSIVIYVITNFGSLFGSK
jgi:chromosome segregation ATPase